MAYKLWIPSQNLGVLKHIENLGGAWFSEGDSVYQVRGVPAHKIRDMTGVVVMSHPRTQIELAWIEAVTDRFVR